MIFHLSFSTCHECYSKNHEIHECYFKYTLRILTLLSNTIKEKSSRQKYDINVFSIYFEYIETVSWDDWIEISYNGCKIYMASMFSRFSIIFKILVIIF